MTDRSVGPRCGNNPNTRLTPGDRKAVDDFKARLALQAAIKPYIDRAAWVDGDPLMEVIAATVWKHCGRDSEDMPQLVCDDPRTIAAFAAAVARAHAASPAPADRATTLRELEQRKRPNTPPSRPEPRIPDHTVNEEEASTPVKQRADCTELEWAVQERARFERLYTRETVRADLAEDRLRCPRCREDITDYDEDDHVFRTGDERPYCSGECVIAAHRTGLPTADEQSAAVQQPKEARPPTAYSDGKGRTYCLPCAPTVGADVPLTINDVDHWDLCPSCGRHVVDVARSIEESAS